MKLLHINPTPLDQLLPARHTMSKLGSEWRMVFWPKKGAPQAKEAREFQRNFVGIQIPTLIFHDLDQLEEFMDNPPLEWAFLSNYARAVRSVEGQLFVFTQPELNALLESWGFNAGAIQSSSAIGYHELYATRGLVLPYAAQRDAKVRLVGLSLASGAGIWDDMVSYRLARWVQQLAQLQHQIEEQLTTAQLTDCEAWGSTVVLPADIKLSNEKISLVQFYRTNGKPIGQPVPIAGTLAGQRLRLLTHRVSGNESHHVKVKIVAVGTAHLHPFNTMNPRLEGRHPRVPMDVIASA